MPRVSIGMPVRNGAAHIAEAIASLLAQSHADFELVISDNASTDDTIAICESAAARDRRIRLVHQPTNIGATANFNAVLVATDENEFFMWAAHDDTWHPEFLATSLIALDASPDAVLACTLIAYHTEQYTDLLRLAALPWASQLPPLFGSAPESRGMANLIYALMRREILARAGGFGNWSAGTWAIDVLAILRLLTFGPMVPVASGGTPLFIKRPSSTANYGSGISEFWRGCQDVVAAPDSNLNEEMRVALNDIIARCFS